MTENDWRRSELLFREASFSIDESQYEAKHFGSWWIELSRDGLPKQRVVWDGRDRWLIVETFASSGSWMDKWIGRKASEQSAESALMQLEVPVTREWEEQIEQERAGYWNKFQLEQARSTATQLWDAGCYPDYVRELAPFREQLSPAQ